MQKDEEKKKQFFFYLPFLFFDGMNVDSVLSCFVFADITIYETERRNIQKCKWHIYADKKRMNEKSKIKTNRKHAIKCTNIVSSGRVNNMVGFWHSMKNSKYVLKTQTTRDVESIKFTLELSGSEIRSVYFAFKKTCLRIINVCMKSVYRYVHMLFSKGFRL